MTEETKKPKASMWLMGCAGALVLVGIFCAAGGFWFWGKTKAFLADGATQIVTELLENSELPEEQVLAIERDLGRLREGILEGEIAVANLGNMEEELEAFAILGVIQFYSAFVLPNAALTDEEKTAGQRVLQRYARGVDEGTIDPAESDNSLELKAESDSEGGEKFDAEEVRRNLAEFSRIVEEAGVPDEPYQLDLAVRFEQFVDSLLE